MEHTRNNEPTLLQSLIAEELRRIKVIYCPPGSVHGMTVKLKAPIDIPSNEQQGAGEKMYLR